MKRKCPPHDWLRDDNDLSKPDRCTVCGKTYRELMRGFGSNVRPKRVVR